MISQAKLVATLALAVVCLTSFSDTDAEGPMPGHAPIAVAGLMPPEIVQALSATAGSVKNVPYVGSLGIVDAMRKSAVDFGAITADAAYLAFTGRIDRRTAPFDELRGITVIDLKTVHLMVSAHSGARAIVDLRAKKVSLGPPGTGTSLVSKLLLDAHGLTLDDIDAEYVPVAESTRRLMSGDLDAAFMPLVVPSADAAAAARGGARLLEISGPKVEKLRLEYPFLLRTRMAANTYPMQSKVVHTIGVDLLLVCRADTDDLVVYDFLRSYFTALGRITAVTDLSRATGMSIPLHPGAARYYRERELAR